MLDLPRQPSPESVDLFGQYRQLVFLSDSVHHRRIVWCESGAVDLIQHACLLPARDDDVRMEIPVTMGPENRKRLHPLEPLDFSGGPSENRTRNLLIKSQLLCLVELTARIGGCFERKSF
jgi:hypothetical protein